MNTETENHDGSGAKLQGAFGDRGTNLNAGMAYGHPYGEVIIEKAKEVLRETETGRILVKVQEVHQVPIHVLKGNGESGYNLQAGVIYVPISGKKDKLDARTIILFTKALRALEQEYIGLETPKPTQDVMEYAATLHTKNLDSILYGCKIVKELTNSSFFSDLLEALEDFGYSKLYRAYEKNASTQELLEIYSGRQ